MSNCIQIHRRWVSVQTKGSVEKCYYQIGKSSEHLNNIFWSSHSTPVCPKIAFVTFLLVFSFPNVAPPNLLEVFHSAAQVAVLNKVLPNFHSFTVWDLLSSVAHCLCKQKICPSIRR